DSSFGTGGVTATAFAGSDLATALAIQQDYKIVAAGTAGDPALGVAGREFAVARYDAGEVVPPPPPQPDFSLSINPAVVTASRGTTISVTVTIGRIAGFDGKVTISPPAPITGIIFKPGEPVATAESSVALNLKLKGKATVGEHDLTFTGTDSGGRTRATTLKLIVQ